MGFFWYEEISRQLGLCFLPNLPPFHSITLLSCLWKLAHRAQAACKAFDVLSQATRCCGHQGLTIDLPCESSGPLAHGTLEEGWLEQHLCLPETMQLFPYPIAQPCPLHRASALNVCAVYAALVGAPAHPDNKICYWFMPFI